LTKLSAENWANAGADGKPAAAFNPELVNTIYNDELGGSSDQPPGLKRVMMLEVSQYLENYLWPNFSAETASFEHVMSIILMVNEKFREGVPAWASFEKRKVGCGWW
jgi:intron-binding protein aquarius